MTLAWAVLRVCFGLFFIVTALLVTIQYGGEQPPAAQPRAQAFYDGLNASGFINPLLIIIHIAGGGLLLVRRTAPLGLALLTPSVTVILMTHLVLTGAWAIAVATAAIWAALVWRFREPFIAFARARA